MGDGSCNELLEIYSVLYNHYGDQGWWPSDNSFETIIGAILAQNVSWKGAKKAVLNLKSEGLMIPETLFNTDLQKIAELIKSSRYYNQKAHKIKIFMDFFYYRYSLDITQMASKPDNSIRREILELKGFGPETVDSILLYALNKPVFVVDAYTRRIGTRQGWFSGNLSYSEIQDFFYQNLPEDISLFNDFHAQIVNLGNLVCRTNPRCSECPIKKNKSKISCCYGCNTH